MNGIACVGERPQQAGFAVFATRLEWQVATQTRSRQATAGAPKVEQRVSSRAMLTGKDQGRSDALNGRKRDSGRSS
jgi:hypothetical protein